MGADDPSSLPADFTASLPETNCTVRYCPDVYRGVARIGRMRPAVVVVVVDRLGGTEVEFIRLLRRIDRELPILVHGGERWAARIDQALAAGASGRFTAAALREATGRLADGEFGAQTAGAGRRVAPSSVARTPVLFAPTGNLSNTGTGRAVRAGRPKTGSESEGASRDTGTAMPSPPLPRNSGPAAGASANHAAGEQETASGDDEREDRVAASQSMTLSDSTPDVHEDSDKEPVIGDKSHGPRVPWVKYHAGPRRTPPHRSPAPLRPAADDGPLLTPEELRALLGGESVEDV